MSTAPPLGGLRRPAGPTESGRRGGSRDRPEALPLSPEGFERAAVPHGPPSSTARLADFRRRPAQGPRIESCFRGPRFYLLPGKRLGRRAIAHSGPPSAGGSTRPLAEERGGAKNAFMRISARKAPAIRGPEPSRVLGALAEPTRLRIVAILLHVEEICGCDVEAVLGTTQSRASRHLSTLRAAGIVEDERRGAWVYHRLAARAPRWLRSILEAVHAAVRADPEVGRALDRLERRGRSRDCDGLLSRGRGRVRSARLTCCG
jgi:ArsR family transcriptional regulator, arsenate/arsenite/antimonite-responsive transcriptional repressor